jgi:hypothetical protein
VPKHGLQRLRENRKFELKDKHDVIIYFGKFNGLTFSKIAKLEPEYFQFLLDTQDGKVTEEVKKRMVYWADRSLSFWI